MKRLLLLSAILIVAISCDDNSYDYGYDRYYEEIVTAQGNNIFRLDSGESLINVNEKLRSFNAGERVYLHYTLLDQTTPGYDYTVRVNGAGTVSLGDLLPTGQKEIETFPAHPVQFESCWIGGNYLNMQFYIDFKSEKHTIALLTDSLQLGNDTIRLYFRHDTNNDPPGYPTHLYLSFDLKKALGDPAKNRPLLFYINTSNYGEKSYELIY